MKIDVVCECMAVFSNGWECLGAYSARKACHPKRRLFIVIARTSSLWKSILDASMHERTGVRIFCDDFHNNHAFYVSKLSIRNTYLPVGRCIERCVGVGMCLIWFSMCGIFGNVHTSTHYRVEGQKSIWSETEQ